MENSPKGIKRGSQADRERGASQGERERRGAARRKRGSAHNFIVILFGRSTLSVELAGSRVTRGPIYYGGNRAFINAKQRLLPDPVARSRNFAPLLGARIRSRIISLPLSPPPLATESCQRQCVISHYDSIEPSEYLLRETSGARHRSSEESIEMLEIFEMRASGLQTAPWKRRKRKSRARVDQVHNSQDPFRRYELYI